MKVTWFWFTVCLGFTQLTQAVLAAPIELHVNTKQSTILAITGRTGPLTLLGHDHAILAEEWSSQVFFDEDNPSGSSLRVTLNSKSLVIDSERARRLAHLGGSGPKASDRAMIQEKMLGPKFLDAARFPEIVLTSTQIRVESPNQLQLFGTLALRDRENPIASPILVQKIDGQHYSFSGAFTTKQTEYGIKPESVLGGLLKVKNEVIIRFQILASTTPDADAPGL